ncbi:MAG: hypothetical protein BWY14_01176 [Parcubacteria group bacterium ADurb.Bin192]|nr:MAG: hypothetical protein BWY14_01176 [Parcubacteria group bacterium ADurb.Bin192]
MEAFNMAGETTSFFANAILSGLNQGLQGRRALKEEERLKALKLQQAAEDRANKIADYQQQQEIAQNIKNRALADKQEQMINAAALLGRETNNPWLAHYGIAKAFGLEGGLNPVETGGANARNSKGASSNLKAIKSDDTLKKIQFLKALRDYNESLSEKQDEFGNTIPAKLSDADRRELALFEERLVRDLYAGGEQLDQGSPNGTPTLGDARAMLFGSAARPAANSAASNTPTVNAPNALTVDAPTATPTEPDVTPSYTVSLLPVTEPTLYEDAARAGEIGMRALSNAIRQGRSELGDYYDKVSAPTTPEEYSKLSALQKIIYKLTGKNIDPKRLEQILNKER